MLSRNVPRETQPTLFTPEPALTPWEAAAESDRLVAHVVVSRPLDTVYQYLVPDDLRGLIAPGQRVRVPFGRGDRLTTGYCTGITAGAPTIQRLKTLVELVDREPLLSGEMLELTKWMAQRYLCSWGQVLEAVIPAGVKKQAGTREITCFELVSSPGARERLDERKLPAKQRSVLKALEEAGGPLAIDELAAMADCGTSPIRALQRKGLIVPIRRRTDAFTASIGPIEKHRDLELNSDQRRVLDHLLGLIRSATHATVLLHGVTGSGKTEVYIQAIQEVVTYGRQAIVLVPEISLTPQTIRRFRSRFPSVAVLHSHLSDAERHWQWQRIAGGDVQVVVGARSAVFAPTPHLGLIVIDEEHETTFKQQTTPRYHAREVARERARREKVPLLLGSATPTLESRGAPPGRKDV
jgi:primosomal protein N' (replication factor Y)